MANYPSVNTDMSATLITTEFAGFSSYNAYNLKNVYPGLYSPASGPGYQVNPYGGLTEEQALWEELVQASIDAGGSASIASIAISGATPAVITITTTLTVVAGAAVYINGVTNGTGATGWTSANGSWTVATFASGSPNTITINMAGAQATTGSANLTGAVVALQYSIGAGMGLGTQFYLGEIVPVTPPVYLEEVV